MDSLKRELNETKKKEKNSEQNVRELQQFIEHFRQQQGKISVRIPLEYRLGYIRVSVRAWVFEILNLEIKL